MGFGEKMVFNRQEEKTVRELDQQKGGNLYEKEKTISQKAETDYKAYLENGNEQLWQMRNSNLIEQIKEAKSLLEQFGSSQIIEQRLEDGQIESDHDEARIVAICRAIETNTH